MKSALLLALAAATAASSFGCKRGAERSAQAAEPAKVPPGQVWLTAEEAAKRHLETAKVSEQALDGTLVTSGRITFDDVRVAHIYSPVSGRVIRIDAQLGQRVKKGDVLAVITSPDVGTTVSDLKKAEADFIAAGHVYKRERDLMIEGAGTESALEQAQDAYNQAKAEKERAEQKTRLLRAGGFDAVNQTYTVSSPIDGELIMRNLNPGIEVQGQYGGNNVTELFTVGELDGIWVFADVYEADLARIHEGATCTVRTVTYKDRKFEGKVDWVAGALDPMTRTAKVRCTLANQDHALKPEMYATAYISAETRSDLAVPRSAVLQMGDTSVVFVKLGEADGRVKLERIPVTVDDVGSESWLVVQHGIEPGQEVVTTGVQTLSADL